MVSDSPWIVRRLWGPRLRRRRMVPENECLCGSGVEPICAVSAEYDVGIAPSAYSGSLSRLLHPESRRSFEQVTLHAQPRQFGPLTGRETLVFATVDARLTHRFPRFDSPIPKLRVIDAILRPSSSTNATASALNSFGNDLRVRPGGNTGPDRLCSCITDMATSSSR